MYSLDLFTSCLSDIKSVQSNLDLRTPLFTHFRFTY
jgi:hypothetical protein